MSIEENTQEDMPGENTREGINEPNLPTRKPPISPDHKESVERGREKEYARSLYDEFYADSINYTHKVNARLGQERDCDKVEQDLCSLR